MSRNPFKFLDSYTRKDHELFFGRETESAEAHARLFYSNLLLLYGPSGAGKTSLVQCGVANRFQESDWLPLFIRRKQNIIESMQGEVRRLACSQLPQGASLLASLESVYLDWFRPLFLIFDQLEELLIFGDEAEKEAFVSFLAEVGAAERLPVRTILVIREEYLARLSEFEDRLPRLFDNRLRIEPIRWRRALEVIEKPCGAASVSMEPGLAEHLLGLICPSGEVELSYLQVYLDRLYRHAARQGGEEVSLTFRNVDELGDVGDVLQTFLEEQITATDNPTDYRVLLKAAVSSDGTKKPLSANDAVLALSGAGAGPESARAMLQRLVDVRVLRELEEGGLFELRHDSLASRVFAWLSEQEKEFIEVEHSMAGRLREFQQKGLLLDAPFLTYVAPFERRLAAPGFKDLLERSRRRLEARRRRRNRVLAIATALVLLFGLGLGLMFYQQRQEAQNIAKLNRFILNISQDKGFLFQRIGDLLCREKDYPAAAEAYQKALAARPGDLDVLFQLAVVYASSSKFAEAAETLETMLRFQAYDAEAWGRLGWAYSQILVGSRGETEDSLGGPQIARSIPMEAELEQRARVACANAQRIQPDCPWAWLALAEVARWKGRWEESFDALQKAFLGFRDAPSPDSSGEDLMKDASVLMANLGGLTYAADEAERSNHLELASAAAKLAISMRATTAEQALAWWVLGCLHTDQKHLAQAESAFRQSIIGACTSNQKYELWFYSRVEELEHLIEVCIEKKEFAIACRVIQLLTRIDASKEERLLEFSDRFFNQGAYQEAAELYRAFLYKFPSRVDVWTSFGIACLRRGDTENAATALRKAAELAPRNPDRWTDLAAVERARAAWPAAEAAHRKALELFPNSARALDEYGLTLFLAGRTTEALAQVEKALRFNPSALDARFHRGAILAALGLWEESLAENRRALEEGAPMQHEILRAAWEGLSDRFLARCPEARFLRGWLLVQANDYQHARQELERFLAECPAPEAWRKQAQTLTAASGGQP